MEDCANGGDRIATALALLLGSRSGPPAPAAVVVSTTTLLLDGRLATTRVLTDEAEGSVRIDGTRCKPPKPPNDLRGADNITWDHSM